MQKTESQYFSDMISLVKQKMLMGIHDESFLREHGAVTKDGMVVADYPVLKYEVGGKEQRYDIAGNINLLKEKKNTLQNEGIVGRIEYLPRLYSYFLEAKSLIEKEMNSIAEEKNCKECKFEDAEGWKFTVDGKWCTCVIDYLKR